MGNTTKIIKKVLKDKIVGGKADGKSPSKYDPEQLEMGIKIEREHTKDAKLAQEIAQDHLEEDPLYYTHLIAMEKKHKRD